MDCFLLLTRIKVVTIKRSLKEGHPGSCIWSLLLSVRDGIFFLLRQHLKICATKAESIWSEETRNLRRRGRDLIPTKVVLPFVFSLFFVGVETGYLSNSSLPRKIVVCYAYIAF